MQPRPIQPQAIESQTNADPTEAARREVQQDFDRLFAEHANEIRAFLERRVTGKLARRLDANDLLQETSLAAFRQFSTFSRQPTVPARIWLLMTAKQQLLNAYRHHLICAKRTVLREQEWSDCSSAAIASGLMAAGSSPSKQLRRAEVHEQLQEALFELSETDREILLMRHFESRQYSEIAMLLELEEATVRQRFGRALMRLRSIVKRLGIIDCMM